MPDEMTPQGSSSEAAPERPQVDRKARFKIPPHRPDKQPAAERTQN